MREITDVRFRQVNPNGGFHYWGYVDKKYKDTFTSPIFGKSEQYTGLKDKNGKEIYKNSKVKDKHGIEYIVRIGPFFNGKRSAIGVHLYDIDENIVHGSFDFDDELEIIGNIHQVIGE